MPNLLGIDYGQSKIGLALADSETKTAVPFGMVKSNNLFSIIKDIIKSENIDKIVIGLPLNMSGEETAQTNITQEFIEDLKVKTGLEVITEDERLTSVQANRLGKDDAVAAMYILQTYIDKHY